MATEFPFLHSGDVHLWLVHARAATDTAFAGRCEALLSPTERERAERFVAPKSRHQFISARACLRDLLSRYHPAVEATDWCFGASEHGKPFVEQPAQLTDLGFNVSHTDDLTTIVVARSGALGVDVEADDRPANFLEIAERYFSPAEWSFLEAEPPAARASAFYGLWTLKEAYLKARGEGLTVPLKSFSISWSADHAEVGSVVLDMADSTLPDPRWQFWQFLVGSHIVAAAASGGRNAAPRSIHAWNMEPLGGISPASITLLRRSLV